MVNDGLSPVRQNENTISPRNLTPFVPLFFGLTAFTPKPGESSNSLESVIRFIGLILLSIPLWLPIVTSMYDRKKKK